MEERICRTMPTCRLDGLSEAAQQRVREVAEALNPLAQLVARARGRRSRAGSPDDCVSRGEQASPGEASTTSHAATKRSGRERKRRDDARDLRLPPPGAILRRIYQGRELLVHVLDQGFEFEGRLFRSLSAIAKEVTGAHWNGLLFFGFVRQER